MPIISLSDVTAGYSASSPVLTNFNLSIEKGTMTVLFGKSGSGKTTLFRLLTGELCPTAGEVTVADIAVSTLGQRALANYRRSIGIVSSDVKLIENRTVEENLALSLEIGGMKRARLEAQLDVVIERFNLRNARTSYPPDLSMSERQRTAIARAVIQEPLVLFVDEPTAHLDTTASREIAELLSHENLRGMTILIGTSDERFVSALPQSSIVTL